MTTEAESSTAPSEIPTEADSSDTSEAVDESGENPAPEEEQPQDPLREAQDKAARLKDQLLRTAADFDNFRKRSRREIEDARTSGREAMLKELLPVFDNLERALTAAETASDVKSFASGIEMVTRQFHETLGKSGIERILSVGTAFDPALHEAVQHLETADHEPGHVVAEVQGGYKSEQRLLRPAVVVVAKAPTKAAEGQDAEVGDEPSGE